MLILELLRAQIAERRMKSACVVNLLDGLLRAFPSRRRATDPEQEVTLELLGVRIALNEFGTRYSSLAYLKNLPFDTIKIDRYFIEDVETDEIS